MSKKEKVNLFDIVPYISEHIKTEMEGEIAVITFPRFRNKFMRKFFVPRGKSADIHIKLEEHGTAVWNLIDGIRTVKVIAEELANHFNHEDNYELRISSFIMQIHSNGFIKYRAIN